MKSNKAFTLIEMSAVIIIILMLIGISLPLLNKGSSTQEVKLTANSVQSILSLCSSMAKSAGKVYLADMDLNFNASNRIAPPASAKISGTDLYRFSVIRIYSAKWDNVSGKIVYPFENDSYDIPSTIAAYLNISSPQSDHIYFKPDGSVSSDGINLTLLLAPVGKTELWTKVDITKGTGSISITSYKDN